MSVGNVGRKPPGSRHAKIPSKPPRDVKEKRDTLPPPSSPPLPPPSPPPMERKSTGPTPPPRTTQVGNEYVAGTGEIFSPSKMPVEEGNPRILIITDYSGKIRKRWQRAILRNDEGGYFQVETIKADGWNIQGSLAQIDGWGPDMIIIDICAGMKGRGGKFAPELRDKAFKLAKNIREEYPFISIICVVKDETLLPSDAGDLNVSGLFSRFFTKPPTEENLMTGIAKAFEDHQKILERENMELLVELFKARGQILGPIAAKYNNIFQKLEYAVYGLNIKFSNLKRALGIIQSEIDLIEENLSSISKIVEDYKPFTGSLNENGKGGKEGVFDSSLAIEKAISDAKMISPYGKEISKHISKSLFLFGRQQFFTLALTDLLLRSCEITASDEIKLTSRQEDDNLIVDVDFAGTFEEANLSNGRIDVVKKVAARMGGEFNIKRNEESILFELALPLFVRK